VAIADPDAALKALRYRRPDVEASTMTVVGEATPDCVEWLGVKDGDIFCVVAVS
jgi:hypothetical protein